MNRSLMSLVAAAGLLCVASSVYADTVAAAPALTKHQMMKECMAKQKASDGGMPKAEMKKNCRDLTNTKSENARAEKAGSDQSAAPPRN